MQPFVVAVAESTNTDPSNTALPLLSLLGVAVGTTRALMPKKEWTVFPCVWACVVGRSVSGKSPPLTLINGALAPLIDDLNDENRLAADEYAEAKTRHMADRSKRGVPPPPEPPAKRLRIGDVTIESAAGILMHNPRGLWLSEDEIHSWFGGFTSYRAGKDHGDRPRWLKLFDGGVLEVDRKTGEQRHISLKNAMVGIAGGIQPASLRQAMTPENVSAGLFARIRLTFPPGRVTEWSDYEISDGMIPALTDLLRAFRRYDFTTVGGRPVPVLNRLHADAKPLETAFYNANRRWADVGDDAEAATTVKLESYALPFAHLRHLCRYAGRDDSAPSRSPTCRPASNWPSGSWASSTASRRCWPSRSGCRGNGDWCRGSGRRAAGSRSETSRRRTTAAIRT